MKRFLHRIVPPILTLLLGASALLLPPAVSRLRDSLTLSGVHVEEMTLTPAGSGLSTGEKLELIFLSRQGSANIIQSYQNFGVFRMDDVLKAARTGLEELEDTGLLPVRMTKYIDGCESALLVTYTDPSDLSRTVSVWEAVLAAGGWWFTVTMDVETGKVYEFSWGLGSSDNLAVSDGEAAWTLESDPFPEDPEGALRRFASLLDVTLEDISPAVELPLSWRASVAGSSASYRYTLDGYGMLSLTLEA